MDWDNIKRGLKKFWDFLWHEDSLSSLIVLLILAFIVVKFIFFPLLSLITSTSMPLVVVESGSMHHPGGFIGNTLGLQSSFNKWWQQQENWYQEIGINKEQAEQWPLNTGLEKGDIVAVTGYGEREIGDVIIFKGNRNHPIIHRIVNIKNIDKETYYETKGDNNQGQLPVEKNIPENRVIGEALFRIPKIGWIKLALVEFIQIFI